MFKISQSCELQNASLISSDEAIPFDIECDAPEKAISVTLNQRGRSVAFMSRALQPADLHYPRVEREKERLQHLLARLHSTLITGQREVAFMLDNKKCT